MSWERVEEKDGLETAILKGTKPGGPAAKVAGSLGLINGVTLVSVDGTRCAGLGYKDQINLIREAGRPVTMIFGPKGKSVAWTEIEDLYRRYNPEKLEGMAGLVEKYGERKLLASILLFLLFLRDKSCRSSHLFRR